MWTRLSSKDEWLAYITATAKTLDIPANQISWGGGPQGFPCLVCSHMPPPVPNATPKVYSAFVYTADAEALLGRQAGPSVADVVHAATVMPTQDKFNRWLTAQMLTVVHFMVETGICREEVFEEKMLEFLENVDRWKKEKTAELVTGLSKLTRTMIDKLDTNPF